MHSDNIVVIIKTEILYEFYIYILYIEYENTNYINISNNSTTYHFIV